MIVNLELGQAQSVSSIIFCLNHKDITHSLQLRTKIKAFYRTFYHYTLFQLLFFHDTDITLHRAKRGLPTSDVIITLNYDKLVKGILFYLSVLAFTLGNLAVGPIFKL